MIKIAIYSSHPFEKPFLIAANEEKFELIFINEALSSENIRACEGCKGIALFTSDDSSAPILEQLKSQGIEFIVTRSTHSLSAAATQKSDSPEGDETQ